MSFSTRTLAVLALALGIAAPARALSPEAEAAYEAGKAALKAERFGPALERFREARRLSEGVESDVWQMLLAIALTHERMNHPGHAIETYREFLERAERHSSVLTEKWRERRRLAEETVRDLERRTLESMGFVSVVTDPPGAALLVDGRAAGREGDARTPFGVYLPPGPHDVRVEKEGYLPEAETVTVAKGQLSALTLTLAAGPAAAEPDEAPPAFDDAAPPAANVLKEAPREAPSVLGPVALSGTGVALAAAGFLFTLDAAAAEDALAEMKASDPPPTQSAWRRESDRLERSQQVSWVLYGAGAAAVAGGVLWLFLRDDGGDAPMSLDLRPSPGGASIAITWRPGP